MKLHLISIAALLAVSPAFAQTRTISTASDYTNWAKSGNTTSLKGVKKGTAVTRGLRVWASVGRSRYSSSYASTSVFPSTSRTYGRGVSISESGRAVSTGSSGDASVGSSNSAPDSKTPTLGNHDVEVKIAVKAGTKGRVTIFWSGRQSSMDASIGATVDVDGDDKADFTGGDNKGRTERKTIAVTAGANGVVLRISTGGKAAIKGARGSRSYSGRLSAYFTTGDAPGDCTFTAFGKECGGKLAGSARNSFSGRSITLSITGAAKNAIGVIGIGKKLSTPIKLPGSMCTLDVDPMAQISFRTGSTGSTRRSFFSRGSDLDTNMQAVTLALTSKGAELASTNGLNVVCK